ncbi:hypothetical protein SAMN04487917_11239 [Arthrobacter sp. yr096]|nr:hypothetical protein SAMN04487917_11239 [Arthrobacter sp. yr096]
MWAVYACARSNGMLMLTPLPLGRARRKRDSAAVHHMMLRGLRQAPAPALPEPNQRDTATGVRFWVFKCK